MSDLIGLTINNYTVQEKLGGGGMGIVYRARHPILDLDVAIKVMRPDLANQPGFYARFEREAQTIARLQHPGIVTITNFGQHDGITYLMMDYIEGPTLRSLLRDSPFGLPLATAARIIQKVAEALDYAHSKGVLHLDLKPDNILLDPDRSETSAVALDCPYRPVISDFGLARLRLAPGISIHDNSFIGTPHYMSPEQCQGKSLNDRTDIYALGVMFFEALTGRRPFPITNMAQAVYYHGTQPAKPPSTHLAGFPAGVDALALEMLAKNPPDRPFSGGRVAERLVRILSSLTPAPTTGDLKAHDGAVVTPPEVESWSAGRAPVYIVVNYEGKQIDRFPMTSESILAGRLPTCELRLEAGDKLVSKRHCEIRRRNGEMQVRDLHSTNKTFLDEVELDPDVYTPWPDGAPVRMGLFTLEWRLAQTDGLPAIPEGEAPVLPPESVDGPWLRCENASPTELRLTSRPVTIGRLPNCDLVIADPAVSKRHCALQWDGRQVGVEDLNSTNGTFLGERRLESGQFNPWPADVDLRIGPHTIRLEPADSPESE